MKAQGEDTKKNQADAAAMHASTGAVVQEATRNLACFDSLFEALYPTSLPDSVDGMTASRNERLSKGYKSCTLTYGEVSVHGVSS